MPYLTARACEQCGRSFTPGVDGEGWFCSEHVAQRSHEKNVADYSKRKDDPIGKLYHQARWINMRKAYLVRNPMCLALDDDGFGHKRQCRYPATDLHHIISPRERLDLMYEWSNIRGLCKAHHHKKAGEPKTDPRDYVVPVLFSMTYGTV